MELIDTRENNKMKISVFTIPIYAGSEQENELNVFLCSHRILSVDKRFVEAGMDSFWSICVTWADVKDQVPVQKGKVDYKQVLDEHQFTIYAALRELRKKLAEHEGVPAYALFTNDRCWFKSPDLNHVDLNYTLYRLHKRV